MPEPYQPAPGERWRVGSKVGRNLYAVTPEHPEGIDIGRMDTPGLAALVVDAVNDYLIAVDRRHQHEEAQRG